MEAASFPYALSLIMAFSSYFSLSHSFSPSFSPSPHSFFALSFSLSTPPQGENLDLAIHKDEVVVLVGEGVCAVKTLTRNHLYCEPPPLQPAPGGPGRNREGGDTLPEFTVSQLNVITLTEPQW